MRRGYLYSNAQELGCNKIALGHHFNDVIETTLMGMFYGAQLQAMLPKLHSTNFPGMDADPPAVPASARTTSSRGARYNELQFIQCACQFYRGLHDLQRRAESTPSVRRSRSCCAA